MLSKTLHRYSIFLVEKYGLGCSVDQKKKKAYIFEVFSNKNEIIAEWNKSSLDGHLNWKFIRKHFYFHELNSFRVQNRMSQTWVRLLCRRISSVTERSLRVIISLTRSHPNIRKKKGVGEKGTLSHSMIVLYEVTYSFVGVLSYEFFENWEILWILIEELLSKPPFLLKKKNYKIIIITISIIFWLLANGMPDLSSV